MTRYILCCAVLCIPLGCVGSAVDEDAGGLEVPGDGGFHDKAHESGPCKGEECNGRRPHGTGCEEDRVLLERTSFAAVDYGKKDSPGGFYVLYYSPSCEGKWVEVYRDESYYSTAWVETPEGDGVAESIWDLAGKGWTSSMFYTPPGVRVRACIDATSCKGPCDYGYSTRYCSEYH
jgi:hypothetical protein